MTFLNKLKNISAIVFIFTALLFTSSCASKKKGQASDKPKKEVKAKTDYSNYQKATIMKEELDGCTWMVILEGGKKLEPQNLADEYKVDQQKVYVQYKPYKGLSICMMGEMVTITAIAKRE